MENNGTLCKTLYGINKSVVIKDVPTDIDDRDISESLGRSYSGTTLQSPCARGHISMYMSILLPTPDHAPSAGINSG